MLVLKSVIIKLMFCTNKIIKVVIRLLIIIIIFLGIEFILITIEFLAVF